MNSLVGSNYGHKTIAIYSLFFIAIMAKEMGKGWDGCEKF